MNNPLADLPEAEELAALFAAPRRDPAPEPGIYLDVPMADYLRWDAVSASQLGEMMKSPAHARAHYEEPETIQPQSTVPTIVGIAGHCAVLEPDTFTTRYRLGPAGSWSLKANKDAVAQIRAEYPGATVLKPYQYNSVLRARDSILDHPNAGRLVRAAALVEVSIVWDDPATGVRCKARPDALLPEHQVIVDLKSAAEASRRGFARAIANFGYHRKAAFYLDGMEQAARACNPAHGILGSVYTNFVFIAFEKVPPYAVAVYDLDPETIDKGRQMCQKYLEIYADCKAANVWPAYDPDITMISAPEWALYQEI